MDGLTEKERKKAIAEHMKEIDNHIEKQKQQKNQTDEEDGLSAESEENVPSAKGKRKRGKRAAKKPKVQTKKQQEFGIKVAVASEVRKNPALYQLTHKGYQDRQLTESLWKSVSENVSKIIGEEKLPQDCKDIWRAMRESCR